MQTENWNGDVFVSSPFSSFLKKKIRAKQKPNKLTVLKLVKPLGIRSGQRNTEYLFMQ